MAQVAQRAGVNKATVSRVLAGQDGYVSAATRRRILEAVQELNYQPNLVASSLKKRETHMIAFIVPDIANAFFPVVFRGVEDVLREAGYYLVVCSTDQEEERELEYLRMVSRRQADGIIVATSGGLAQFLREQVPSFPIVLVDRDVPGSQFDRVLIDNEQAVMQGVDYLKGLGHRDILLVTAPYANVTSRTKRVEGFHKAVRSYDLQGRVVVIHERSFDGYNELVNLLCSRDAPTAILSLNPLITTLTLRAIRTAGLSIPQDISVLAFDDVPWAEAMAPALTVLAQPSLEVGKTAARLILERLRKRSRSRRSEEPSEEMKGFRPETIVFTAQLIKRMSCAPPRNLRENRRLTHAVG